jgi:hypothetical protein
MKTIKTNGLNISITEIITYQPRNQSISPKEGNRFLALMLNLENVSNEPKFYTGLDYRLKNKNGTEYNAGYTDITPELGSSNLSFGDQTSGYVVFEVPDDIEIKDLDFMYDPVLSGEIQQTITDLQEINGVGQTQ